MRFILLLVIAFIFMIIARGVARQYKDRQNFFETILSFLNAYELNIGFKKEKIIDIIEKLDLKGQDKLLFKEYANFLKNDNDLFFKDIKFTTEEERIFLVDMFKSIGTCDFSTEMAQLKIFKSYLQEKIDKAKAENSQKAPLVLKLSVLFCIGFVLVFI